ncbi:hypothetical protein N866_13595 [Actinotalea ferrariae CF5-4]|uniref:Uncharacterized protein n=1 Tax=Actinotalea ferrariae CF5-4 TaxID=948458 RepID=A0A021VYW9_9CELL|nr:hypothetical protein [Actinotalea ferrariae]EYR64277.1 hypothetical protein N866_13595 [Actinotalea ferrariae CF5-4]
MSDLDVMGLLGAVMPQGPDRAADASLTVVGAVYAVDAPARLVQVDIKGSPLWLPAQPGRYRVAVNEGALGLARVLLNPTTGRPVLVLGPVDPRRPVIPGTLTAIDTTARVATVSLDGATYDLPYLASTYTVGGPVWVGLTDWGVPFLVHGPSDAPAAPVVAPVAPAPTGTVQVTQTIGPQWSGTYRVSRGAWDRWNTGEYGGRSDLYQGDAYGSGTLIGLATYGDQLANLGAVSIDAITLRARRNGSGAGDAALTVQGTPHGERPGLVSASGSTASTGAVGLNQWASVDLPADMREGFRTGAIKGLAAVGGTYSGWGGTGTAGSMVLSVTYTRQA